MIQSLDELKIAASRLSIEDRAALAHYLLHTLDAEEPGAAEAWSDLATRRMADVHAGLVTGIPADEVIPLGLATNAAITYFEIGTKPNSIRLRRVASLEAIVEHLHEPSSEARTARKRAALVALDASGA